MLCGSQEGKAAAKGKGPVAGPLHHANSLLEGVRTTLRRNAASHPDLAHSGGSGSIAVPADPVDNAAKASSLHCTMLNLCTSVIQPTLQPESSAHVSHAQPLPIHD